MRKLSLQVLENVGRAVVVVAGLANPLDFQTVVEALVAAVKEVAEVVQKSLA